MRTVAAAVRTTKAPQPTFSPKTQPSNISSASAWQGGAHRTRSLQRPMCFLCMPPPLVPQLRCGPAIHAELASGQALAVVWRGRVALAQPLQRTADGSAPLFCLPLPQLALLVMQLRTQELVAFVLCILIRSKTIGNLGSM